MNNATLYDMWGVCDECQDQLSVFFWLKHTGNQVYKGYLEKSASYYRNNDQLYHRCGGALRLYGPNMRIVLR